MSSKLNAESLPAFGGAGLKDSGLFWRDDQGSEGKKKTNLLMFLPS
jgi:hypothetical protein